MKINNYEEVVKQLTSDENLLITVLIDSGAEQKLGHKYSCPCCKSKDNLNIFSNDGVWFYKCFTSGCFAGTGTVIQYVQHLKGYEKSVDAIKDIVNNYAQYIRIDQDDDFQKMDDFLSRYSIDGHENLRHHYYKNSDGTEIGAKVLFRNNETKKKTGIWFKITENRAIVCSKKTGVAVEDILYNAHKIKDSTEHICITEGEKDADTLSRLGFIATTSQASSKWVDTYTDQIKHCKNFYIFADNDEAGKKSADMIVAALKNEMGEYSTDHAIKIISMPLDIPKADISDYVEILKEKGLNNKQIKDEVLNLIKRSEDLLSVYELHEDNKGIFKWEEEKKGDKFNKKYITDFKLKVLRHVNCLDDESLSHYIVSIKTRFGSEIERSFVNTSMNDISSFKQAIDSPYCTFSGKQADLDQLKKKIFNLDYETQKVVTYGGMRKIGSVWAYIENDSCLINGEVTDEYTINKNTISIESKILQEKEITNEELKELMQHIFSFNNQAICYNVVGYAIATFLKARLREHGIKFPHLFSSGEAGAGKSETLQNILLPFWGLNNMKSASNITKYSLDNYIASNNTIPCILDEYKPYMMAKWRVELISEVMRTSYDWLMSMRGTGRGTVKELEQRTNIVLNGEAGTNETAVIERSVILSFSKKDTLVESQTKHFKWIKANKRLLTKLSVLIIKKVAAMQDNAIKDMYTKAESMISSDIKTTRIRDSLAVTVMGLLLLSSVFKDFDVEAAVNIICNNNLEEVGSTSKSIVDLTLEQIDNALPVIMKRTTELYSLYKVINNGTQIALRVNVIYPEFTKYLKDYNVEFSALSQNEFTKMLRKSEHFINYKTVAFQIEKEGEAIVPNICRASAFVISVDKLKSLDINNLIEPDIE